MRHRASERGVALLGRGLGKDPPNQVHRLILEDSPAYDLAARRRRSRRRDPGCTHGGAVGECHVPVEAVHEHGIVGRDRVDPIALRQGRAAPQLVVPVAAGDPFTRLESRGEVLQPPDEFLGRRRVAQVHRCELEAAVDEVGVSIRKAGENEAAVGPQDLGGTRHVARNLGRVTHGEDLAIRDRDCPGAPPAGRQPGPHRPTLNDQVGLGPAARERQNEDREDGCTAHGGPPNGDG